MKRLFLSALLVALATLAAGEEWVPGTEVRWEGLGMETPLKVFVPTDYDAGRSWPLIYLFHGTGGRASTGLMQRYTEGKGFILVGVPYAVPGQGSLSREGVLKEIQRIGRVRGLLDDSLNLDDRTYVGGFSKGGWMADLLATEGFSTLAGALILGAGRIPADVGRALDRATSKDSEPLSIYIGIGQLDTNHPYSRRAAVHYEARGCDMILEEYLAKAHQPGEQDSVYLTQWLRLQIADAATASAEASQWWEERLAASKTITPAGDRLWFLTHMLNATLCKAGSLGRSATFGEDFATCAGAPRTQG